MEKERESREKGGKLEFMSVYFIWPILCTAKDTFLHFLILISSLSLPGSQWSVVIYNIKFDKKKLKVVKFKKQVDKSDYFGSHKGFHVFVLFCFKPYHT